MSAGDPYAEALARIYERARMGERLGLDVPRALDAALGHPARAARAVLIGGTNGKGSTAAFVEALLRAAGHRTGLFTSPHLVSFRERVRIDGTDVSEDAVAAGVPRVLAAAARAGIDPTFFEVTWALAALAFAEAGVDVAVWEVGLGGRLDATNATDPEASAITSIALDHQAVLGPDLAAIAREKAAIFRAGRPALTAAEGAGLAALEAELAAWEPPQPALAVLGRDFGFAAVDAAGPLPLPGAHQRRNAALACEVTRALGVVPVPAALGTVRWPGRAERFGDVVLDCAHNPHGAEALAAWVRAAGLAPVHLVFGAMADKDVSGVAAVLAPLAGSIDLVTPSHPRRMEAAALRPCFAGHPAVVAGTVADALAARPAGVTTLVTGSCFLVGEARALLTGQPFPERGLATTAR